jgi:hypothetical protein
LGVPRFVPSDALEDPAHRVIAAAFEGRLGLHGGQRFSHAAFEDRGSHEAREARVAEGITGLQDARAHGLSEVGAGQTEGQPGVASLVGQRLVCSFDERCGRREREQL